MVDFGPVQLMEVVSIVLIAASFLLLLTLNLRLKAIRTFQFETLIFSLILLISEIPHILQSLDLLSLTGFEDLGLEMHTIAMVVISGFVAIRVYHYIKR